MNETERDERLGLAAAETDLAQTALAALEAAELMADPAAARAMLDAARDAVMDMAAAARRFAGLPERRRNDDPKHV